MALACLPSPLLEKGIHFIVIRLSGQLLCLKNYPPIFFKNFMSFVTGICNLNEIHHLMLDTDECCKFKYKKKNP